MLFLGMEMAHVLPRWPDTTMEVATEGEVLATVAAMGPVEATEVVATVAAPARIGEGMVGVTEEVPEVATEVAQGETTEGLVGEGSGDLGDSSEEEVAGGAMGVDTLDKEEVVAIKAWLCWYPCMDRKKVHAVCPSCLFAASK